MQVGKPLENLFETYQTLVVLDTETSGLRFDLDEIIELSAVTVQMAGGGPAFPKRKRAGTLWRCCAMGARCWWPTTPTSI